MRFQGVLGKQSLQAANLKGNLGSCCYWLQQWHLSEVWKAVLILKILNRGGNWISEWKVGFPLETLMSQSNSLLFTVGFPIWQLRFEIESSLKSEKRNTVGWISGNALMMKSGKWQTCMTREVVGVPKLESFQTMLETSLEKVGGEEAFLSGKSMESPQCYSGTFLREFDKDRLQEVLIFLCTTRYPLMAQTQHSTKFPLSPCLRYCSPRDKQGSKTASGTKCDKPYK